MDAEALFSCEQPDEEAEAPEESTDAKRLV